MKMLTSRTPISNAEPFVLDVLKAQSRVDFDDDDLELARMGWAAAAELEQFAQIALLTQTIRVTIFDPSPSLGGFNLPIGPVKDGAEVTCTIDAQPFTDFELVTGNRPYLRLGPSWYDMTPSRMSVEYVAGFGDAASDIPPDLAQAHADQAALHYDGRSPMDAKSLTSSPHMARIGARYRGVRA